MRSIVLSLAALMILGAGIAPATAATASAAQIKGRQIINNKPFADTTGNCSCNWPWYTIGANPGTITVNVALTGSIAHEMAPTYAIRVRLYQGKHLLRYGQASCNVTASRCNATVRETLHPNRRTIYFMEVEGPGADGIGFKAWVTGHVFRVQ